MGIFHFPVKIISDKGCLAHIGNEVDQLGARNPLIITDPGVVTTGILDKVTGPLKDKALSFDIFEGVEPDPKIRNVSDATDAVKNNGHDLIIAFGGGSSIDTAKAASILSVNNIDLREFQGIREKYPKRPLPLITVTTTAGSGSEVSSAAIIVDEEKQYKMYFKSPQIFSKVAFLDAEVVTGIPSHIAAAAGADTLTHALESFFNPNRTFITEAASLGAAALAFSNLRPFVENTNNREAAQNMLNASTLAGIAMTTSGLGLVHALAHPVGIKGGINHGLACGVLLPSVLHFNRPAASGQYMRLAIAMDLKMRTEDRKEKEPVDQIINAVEKLLTEIGIPKRLSDIDVALDDVAGVVNEAYNSFLNQVNPRPATRQDIENIVEQII